MIDKRRRMLYPSIRLKGYMPVLDRLPGLADPIRARILALLDRHELSVGELCQALRLPQSTVSRHLKVLGDDGWLRARAEGTSRLYRMVDQLDAPSRTLWQLVREETGATSAARADAARADRIIKARREKSREFFNADADKWDALRAQLFGANAGISALPALFDSSWVVADLGAGTGALTSAIAPFVSKVIAVDESRAMLDAARERLKGATNVELREGELEELPLRDAEADVALLLLVLHHAVDPATVLAEAARVLKPGGRLLVVDMVPHEQADLRERLGHVWQGFSEEQLEAWMSRAGLEDLRVRELAADAEASGPALFAATARRVDHNLKES